MLIQVAAMVFNTCYIYLLLYIPAIFLMSLMCCQSEGKLRGLDEEGTTKASESELATVLEENYLQPSS